MAVNINLGFQTYFGMVQQSAYRTALVVTTKIPFTSESLSDSRNKILSEVLMGNAGHNYADNSPKSVMGQCAAELMYYVLDSGEFVGTDLPLAIAMGANTYDSGGGRSLNQITLENSLTKCATLALLKGETDSANELWEFIGAMCKSFEISGKSGDCFKATFDWICYNLIRSGCVNTANDLTSLPTELPGRLLFSDATFKIATDFTNALANADKVGISEFNLSMNRNLTEPEFATPENSGHTDSDLTLQPVSDGFRDCKLSFTIPRYATDAFITAMNLGSSVQAELDITDGTSTFKIFMPYLLVDKVDIPIPGASHLTQKVECSLLRGSAYNGGAGNTVMLLGDGSTTIEEEFTIEVDNQRTAAIIS